MIWLLLLSSLSLCPSAQSVQHQPLSVLSNTKTNTISDSDWLYEPPENVQVHEVLDAMWMKATIFHLSIKDNLFKWTNKTNNIFTSCIMTSTLFMLLSDFTLCNQCCACVVDGVVPSVHADYVEKLTCAMASLDLQDLIYTVLCYCCLPAKQPSPRIWLHLPSLSPLPPSPCLSLNPGPTMGGCFSKPKPGNQEVWLNLFFLSTWLI